MNLNLQWKPNKSQRDPYLDRESKFIHFSGGLGTGKTTWLCRKIIDLSVINFNIPGGLVAPSYKEYKRDVLPAMEEILDTANVKYDYHKTDMYWTLPWTRAPLYVVTAENKLRGPNWGYAGINELTLIPYARFQEVIGRVRVRNAKLPQIVSCGTPEGFSSEYYAPFIESPIEGLKVYYGSTDDNALNLHPDFVRNMESSYDKTMLAAYRHGQWVSMVGNRFYYGYSPDNNDSPYLERLRVDRQGYEQPKIHISMDFNVDPMAAACWHYIDGKLMAFDEIVLENSTTKQMCDALKARGYYPNDCIIYPDPSGQNRSTKGLPDIQILKQEGFADIRVRSVAPTMRKRQLNVNNLLEKGLILINPKTCPKLKKDLLAVELDPVTMEKVKKNKSLTHLSDGMDYLCDITFPWSGHRSGISQETIR